MSQRRKRKPQPSAKRMAALGATVKRLRAERELTQERLADLADLDYTTVANLELGSGNPTLGVLFRVADALGIRLGDLASQADEISEEADRVSGT